MKFQKKILTGLIVAALLPSFTMPTLLNNQNPLVSEMSVSASTDTYSINGVTYRYEILGNGTDVQSVKLTELVSTTNSSVNIPGSINVNGQTLKVIEIDDDFAEDCDKINRITIPNSVLKIGNKFAYNSSITSINMGSGVKDIGIDFCRDCVNLNTISIPDSVLTIDDNFARASSITSITVGKNVQKIGSCFCNRCKNLSSVTYSGTALMEFGGSYFDNSKFMMQYNSNKAVTFGDWLLKYAGNDSSIKIADLKGDQTITKLGIGVFQNKKNIKSVDLTGIKVIGNNAFNYSSLTTVTHAESLITVGCAVFDGTAWLNSQLKNSDTVILDTILIKYNGSDDCLDFSKKTITSVASQAFKGSNATILKLPSGINYMKQLGLKNLEHLYIDNTEITAYNYQNYPVIKDRILIVIDSNIWKKELAIAKGKEILNSLGIQYVGTGNGNPNNYNELQQYQIINKLYHYVGGHYKYRFDFDGGSSSYLEEMLYEKGMVCRDYADMFKFLLEIAGVNSEFVYSHNHAYNVVQIGSEWYYFDTCWYKMSDKLNNFYLVNKEVLETEKSSHITVDMRTGYAEPRFEEMDTLSSVPTCRYTLGDVNLDGVVNSSDASLLKNYFDGKCKLTNQQLILSDVNKDGNFNANDWLILRTK